VNEGEKRRLIEGYLKSLGRELGEVPGEVRRELVEDVRAHIEEAWAAAPEPSRDALLEIFGRLGEPQALAREQRERLGLAPSGQGSGWEVLAMAAVLLTALLWPLGILLAWLSPRWRDHDKVIATAIPLLGLLLALGLGLSASWSPRPELATARTVVLEGQPPGSAPAAPPSGVSPAQLAGAGLFLYGLVGAPFTAAICLAWRLPSGARRVALLIGVAALALCALLLLLMLPAAGARGTEPASHTLLIDSWR